MALATLARPLPAWAITFAASIALPLVAQPVGGGGQPWPRPPVSTFAYLGVPSLLAPRSRRLTPIGVWLATFAGALAVVGIGDASRHTPAGSG